MSVAAAGAHSGPGQSSYGWGPPKYFDVMSDEFFLCYCEVGRAIAGPFLAPYHAVKAGNLFIAGLAVLNILFTAWMVVITKDLVPFFGFILIVHVVGANGDGPPERAEARLAVAPLAR